MPRRALFAGKFAQHRRKLSAGESQSDEQKRKHVDLELCIGCGFCEAKCPILGQPAIYVTSVGESRSKDNQLLLT
jgi:ferredoxin